MKRGCGPTKCFKTATFRVTLVGVGSIPINWLANLTDAVRHEVLFVVTEAADVERKTSYLPGRSVYEHQQLVLMFEWSNNSRVGGTWSIVTFKETRYGVRGFRGGPSLDKEVNHEILIKFLRSHGIRPDRRNRFKEFGDHGKRELTLGEVYDYLAQWRRRVSHYDIRSNNCKAFANTIYASCKKGTYTPLSDVKNDPKLKWLAEVAGVASTSDC